MEIKFSKRSAKVKKSFIREIFKVLDQPDMISLSGGFPNPDSFPVSAIAAASAKVLASDGKSVLQYSSTEGYVPLRKYISDRYKKRFGLDIPFQQIMITNGSQQALDLLGKILIDEGDDVLVEYPSYLGALQSMTFYEPTFHEVSLKEDGVDLGMLEEYLKDFKPKFFYTVPNFQNPTGLTYSNANRQAVAELINKYETILIEDDPYSELRFYGDDTMPIKSYLGERGVMLGSFSKIISPGMRLGWVVAAPEIMDKLITAKQATDLHTNYFAQRVIHQYLSDNDLDEHVAKIKVMYRARRDCMVSMAAKYFPAGVTTTKPEGGMFMWVTLPEGISSMKLIEKAIAAKIVFVPGDPFYVKRTDANTMRLNYTNCDEAQIEEAIIRLSKVIREAIAEKA
jgi:2-aminoadipate transaminase